MIQEIFLKFFTIIAGPLTIINLRLYYHQNKIKINLNVIKLRLINDKNIY